MLKPEGYIELKFGPRWKYIAPARSFIQNFIAISLSDTARADGIAMATSELLENAVKYADGEETGITLEVFPEQNRVIASVTNQGNAESAAELKALYKKINDGDPLEAYITQMKEAATREDGKSQLGLARIRYELGADLRLNVTDDFVITLTIDAS